MAQLAERLRHLEATLEPAAERASGEPPVGWSDRMVSIQFDSITLATRVNYLRSAQTLEAGIVARGYPRNPIQWP